METMVTGEISSVSSVSQDGRLITVESRAGDMHIDEVTGRLVVYVPRLKGKQALCYASLLPTNLARWLMRDPVTSIPESVDPDMVKALMSLLAVGTSEISRVLDFEGIIRVSIANEDIQCHDEDEVEGGDEAQSQLNGSANTALALYVPPTDIGTPATDFGDVETVSQYASARYERHSSHAHAQISVARSAPNAENQQYNELLKKVVRAARRAHFPTKGPFNMANLQSALSANVAQGYDGLDIGSRYRPSDTFERNFKIGAAGELYVGHTCPCR